MKSDMNDDGNDWELEFSKYNFEFMKTLDDFRLREDFCNVTLGSNDKNFQVHSVVLASSSSYFYEILTESLAHEQHRGVFIETKLGSYLDVLLAYIYGKCIPPSTTKAKALTQLQYWMTVTRCGPELMKEMNKLRVREEFCDVKLRVNGETFPAHRVVLAASSPYFYSLFMSDMREKQARIVRLELPELSSMAELLTYMYTGSVRICESNATELLIAADYLLLEELKVNCSLYLQSTVNASNCLYLHSFARSYDCRNLHDIAWLFAVKHFADVADSDDFLRVSAEGIDELLCSNELEVAEEERVYESLVAWTKHDPSARVQYFDRLFLHNIRLGLIDAKYIRKNLQKEDLIKRSEDCFRKVQQVMSLSQPLRQDELRTGYSAFFLFSLQRDCRNNALKFLCYDIQHGQCLELDPLPDNQAYPDTVELASCDGNVYTVGANGRTCCYNTQTNRWSQLPSIPEFLPSTFSHTKWGHGLASLDGCLYVSGGNTTLGEADGVTIRYSSESNTWKMVASLSVPRCGSCVVTSGGHIYAIGGEGRVLRSRQTVEQYHPDKDCWMQVSPMKVWKGERPKGIAVRDKIFVSMENICEQNSCEIYDTITDQWQIVTSPRAHKFNPPLGTDGSKVYVLGGQSCMRHNLSNLSRLYSIIKVQVLDLSTNQWTHEGSVFTTGSPISSCSMQVHRKLAPSGENSCCIL